MNKSRRLLIGLSALALVAAGGIGATLAISASSDPPAPKYNSLARVVNPSCKVTGISINTAALSDHEARQLVDRIEDRLDLPTVDPYRHGADRLVDALA